MYSDPAVLHVLHYDRWRETRRHLPADAAVLRRHRTECSEVVVVVVEVGFGEADVEVRVQDVQILR